MEWAEWECRWQVELDANCRRVLERRFERQVVHADVRGVGRHNLEPVDAVVGGWPCTDLSVAGLRAGLAGERSGLWREFRRVIAELAPRWVLAENVPGLLSSWSPAEPAPEPVSGATWEVAEGSDCAAVIADLVELGYGVAWRCLDAQFFGVAQQRLRVFLVGHLGAPWSAPAAVLFESASCAGDSPPRRTAPTGVARYLTRSIRGAGAKEQQYTFVGADGDPLNALPAPPLEARPPGDTVDTDKAPILSTALTASMGGNGHTGYGGKDERILAATIAIQDMRAMDEAQHGSGLSDDAVAHTLRAEGADASEDGFGRGTPLLAYRMYPDEIAYPLVTGGGKPGQGYPALRDDMTVRRLTPLECARLQGFPDDWLDGLDLSNSVKYRMLGNAVAVPVVEWIARRLRRAHEVDASGSS